MLLHSILLCLLLSLIASIVILTWVPPVSRDALVHHLAVPELYLKHGSIYEIPSMLFSYYPMNLELLYMIPLWLDNDIAPKFIHLSFGLLTAWLIYVYVRQRFSKSYAILSSFLFLGTPIIVKLSITVYVDLGLIFFSTASLLLLMRWLKDGFPLKVLILSAVFCGLAMGTKYNGLITFLITSFFVPFLYAKHKPEEKPYFCKCVVYYLIFVFVALMIFSPWMIKNYLWTNNPIYPLYNHWFNPHEASSKTVGIFSYRSLIYHEKWWEIALLPIRIFFQGADGNPQYFDGKLNPFLFFLSFFAFFSPEKKENKIQKKEEKIFLSFLALYFCFAFFSSGLRMRYIAPIIPFLVILSTIGFKNVFETCAKLSIRFSKWRWALYLSPFVLIAFCLYLNTQYVINQFKIVNPISYITGKVSREDYIEKYRPEYPVMRYINMSLPSDALIQFIFIGNRGYYCDRNYFFDMKQLKSVFHENTKNASTPYETWEGLKDFGITHILVNEPFFFNWVNRDFEFEDRKLVEAFFEGFIIPLYKKNGYALYHLKDKTTEELFKGLV